MNRFLQYLGVGLVSGALTLGGWGATVVHSMPAAPAEAKAEDTEDAFARAMRIGYEYSRRGDYNTALINFRRALDIKPGNLYAEVAVQNMEFYIQRDRNAIRQGEINTLEARLAQSIEASDWVCAAGTIDRLVTYTEPNSLNRERLLSYRGELGGLLDARTNLESWSTICSPEGALY